MARYLVTGGAGFIGSHLVAELLKQEHVVVVLDNLNTGNEHYIKPFMSNKNFTFIKGDILDDKALKKAMQHIDFVLHHAAIASVQESIAQPEHCSKVNIQGTLKVLQAAKAAGVKKVVYASSAAVYGDDNNNTNNNHATNNTEKEKKETQHPNPLSPYAVTKLAGEYYCKIFSEVYGLPTIVLRYFNVFGEGQNPESEYAAVIPKFIKTMLHGKQPTIYGEGAQTRDFIHVQNVVRANILACKAVEIKFGIYNIASGDAISILDLVKEINQLTGKSSKPITPLFAEKKEGDIEYSCANISHAKKDLHYHVEIPFSEGLKRTIAYFDHHTKSEERENGV